MLYNAPAKGDDGLYFVRATNDDKKKCFIQLNKVKVAAIAGDEVTIDACSAANKKKVTAIDKQNLQAAKDNSVSWFGKEMTTDALKAAYSHAELVADRIPPTKVFSPDQEVVDFSTLAVGRECSMILEFSGMWFAKKAFGPAFNLVQVKIHPEPVKSEYPEEYAFAEEEEEEEDEAPSPEPVEPVAAEPEATEAEAEESPQEEVVAAQE